MKLKPIKDQVVVIVGATSGIGRETAYLLAELGAKLVLAGRSLSELQKLASEIQRQGGQVEIVEADVSDFNQVKGIAERAIEAYGRIDTWAHIAGVTLYATFEKTSPEEFKRIVDVNLMGQAYGAMAALPYLRAQGRGALIHISSVEGRRPLPLQSAYGASKHGMVAFLNSLRMELEQEGAPISVTNIMPAGINTPLFNKALTKMGVLPRPIPPVYEPVVAAEAVVYAAEHPVREMFVGGAGKGLGLMQRLPPGLADAAMRRIGFVGQLTNQPKPASAPNNLFGHVEGYDTVAGDFGKEARSVSLYTESRINPVLRLALGLSLLAVVGVVSARVINMRRQARRTPVQKLGDYVGRRIDRLPVDQVKKLVTDRRKNRPIRWAGRMLYEQLSDRLGR